MHKFAACFVSFRFFVFCLWRTGSYLYLNYFFLLHAVCPVAIFLLGRPYACNCRLHLSVLSRLLSCRWRCGRRVWVRIGVPAIEFRRGDGGEMEEKGCICRRDRSMVWPSRKVRLVWGCFTAVLSRCFCLCVYVFLFLFWSVALLLCCSVVAERYVFVGGAYRAHHGE